MLTGKRLIVGTRGSLLARWQTEWVANRLRTAFPEVDLTVKIVETTGDRDQTTPLHEIGGDGAFTRQLEQALLSKEIDLAVHSLKDLPTALPQGLTLASVPLRDDPRDALVSLSGLRFADLPKGARVGTSSVRRTAQLRNLRPDLEILPLRGNVDTRIRKIGSEVDCAVLALAGLQRLSRHDVPFVALDPALMMPAPGQGALAIEARADDRDLLSALREIEDRDARRTTDAERELLSLLGGGCVVPMGAFATIEGEMIRLAAVVADPSGATMIRDEIVAQSAEAGELLAGRLKRAGADALIAGVQP